MQRQLFEDVPPVDSKTSSLTLAPVGQAWQSDAPGFGLYSEVLHVWQAVAPVADEIFPAGHVWQSVAPLTDAIFPALHVWQIVAPVTDEIFPAWHARQSVLPGCAPLLANRPGVQAAHGTPLPVVNLPATQSLHCLPCPGLDFPGTHAAQTPLVSLAWCTGHPVSCPHDSLTQPPTQVHFPVPCFPEEQEPWPLQVPPPGQRPHARVDGCVVEPTVRKYEGSKGVAPIAQSLHAVRFVASVPA